MAKITPLLLGLSCAAAGLSACSGTPVPANDAGDHPLKCGGIAGFACPPGLLCADDPTDECDPTHGGMDCMGICVINPAGGVKDSSVPDAGVTSDKVIPPAGGAACGKNVCTASQYCCNESCGICAPKGGYCTQQYCD